MSHKIVLSTATSAWLHNFPNFPFCNSLHFIACCVNSRPDTFDGARCKLLMDPCQHFTKKFINIDQPQRAQNGGSPAAGACGMCWNRSDGPFNEVLNSNQRLDDTISSSSSYTCSPKKLQTVSVLPRSSRLSLTQNISPKTTTRPCSHHGTTERVEEFTPFCTAASSIGALPTLSGLSEHYPSPLCDVAQKQSTSRRRTQYERSHTSTDCVVLRRRRSRLRVVFENPQSFRNHPRPPSTHLNTTKSFKNCETPKTCPNPGTTKTNNIQESSAP